MRLRTKLLLITLLVVGIFGAIAYGVWVCNGPNGLERCY